MSQPRTLHTAALLNDGRVLVTGGTVFVPFGEYGFDSVALDSAEIFDPLTGRWSSAPSMHDARAGHLSVTLADGRVLVVGGFRDAATAEIYDPGTNAWSRVANVPDRQRWASATLLEDGRVFLIGWTSRDYPKEQQASLFEPASGNWSAVPASTLVRGGHGAIRLPGGSVLVAGGFDPRGEEPMSLDDAARYDPTTNSWTKAGPMKAVAYDMPVALMPDGRVLALSTPIQIYDPASNTWATIDGPSGFSRSIVLDDGRVLAFPDANGSALAVQLSIYDPAIATWSPSGSFIQIVDMTLTRLSDGRVLSAGGYLGCFRSNPCAGGDIADAWVFDPAGAP